MEHTKKIFIGAIFLFLLFFIKCSTKKETVKYVFPEQMLPHVKEQYKMMCDRGKILWDNNCASCHNVKKGKKNPVPDFREDQLRGYELRVANAKHESTLPDTLVTEEDLSVIMIFLRYKEKNN